MVRLDVLVRKVLQDARERMEKNGAVVETAPELARIVGGDKASALARGEHHPRASSRSIAKKTTGMAAKIRAPK